MTNIADKVRNIVRAHILSYVDESTGAFQAGTKALEARTAQAREIGATEQQIEGMSATYLAVASDLHIEATARALARRNNK